MENITNDVPTIFTADAVPETETTLEPEVEINLHWSGAVGFGLYEVSKDDYISSRFGELDLEEDRNVKHVAQAYVSVKEILQMFVNNDEEEDLWKILHTKNPDPNKAYFICLNDPGQDQAAFALPLLPEDMPKLMEYEEGYGPDDLEE